MSTTHPLKIGRRFSLPLQAQTETFAVLAKRGVGKTYTAMVMAEEFLSNGLRTVILDPVGVCWGLRANAAGTGPGLEVLVLGGDHGDLPLEETAGAMIADLVVEERLSVVLDLSHFLKAQQRRFVTAFAERLYHRNREPIHLILDEADAFIPQRHGAGENRMVGAFETLVRRGRARGIGLTLVTQRSAVLNKNVLTQIECLVAMRTPSPQDRKAIEEWVRTQGDDDTWKTVVGDLPSLPIGEAWFWSPGWLRVCKRIKIRKRRTFDSSATPKPGVRAKAPKKLASVDLESVREQMAATVERAKENDPKHLKAEIRRLAAELAKKPAAEVKTVDVPVITDEDRVQLLSVSQTVDRVADAISETLTGALDEMRTLAGTLDRLGESLAPKAPPAAARRRPPPRAASPSPSVTGAIAEGLNGPMQRILNALAWLEGVGITDPLITAVAFIAGYKPGGGAFNNPKGRLRQTGMIEYAPGKRLLLTAEGRAHAEVPSAPLAVEDLHEMVLSRIDGPMGRILQPLLDAYPNAMTKADLAAAAGYAPSGGAFNNPTGRLRTLGLIDYPDRGLVVALPVLFLEAAV